MSYVLFYCQGFLISAAPSKPYAVFTNISETTFVQGATLFSTSWRDKKDIRVVISS
jgi:hypothetical protein